MVLMLLQKNVISKRRDMLRKIVDDMRAKKYKVFSYSIYIYNVDITGVRPALDFQKTVFFFLQVHFKVLKTLLN